MQTLVILASAVSMTMAVATSHAPHWGYEGKEGPEHWGALASEYATCSLGKAQSPIDHAAFDPKQTVTVKTNYHAGPVSLLHNGHTIQANFAPGSTLVSGTHSYNLVQVHFHTPSEEAFNGKHYPMVAHFVHKDIDGKLAVLGVMFEEGNAHDELGKLTAAAPKAYTPEGNYKITQIDPSALLPQDLHVLRYTGSLTTPPCTEGVTWHVAVKPVHASKEQIGALHTVMGHNARPVQPLNGRHLIAD